MNESAKKVSLLHQGSAKQEEVSISNFKTKILAMVQANSVSGLGLLILLAIDGLEYHRCTWIGH